MVTRLRTQYLFFFALAAVVPVLVLGIVEFSLLQRDVPEREQRVLDENQRLADLLAANLRYQLNLVLDPVQRAAGSSAAPTSRPTGGTLSQWMSTTPLFRHLLLVERRRVVASARSTLWLGRLLPPAALPGPGNRPAAVFYSPMFPSLYDGAPLAAVVVAFPDFSRSALVGLLDLNVLDSQLQVQATPTRRVAIVDQTAQALAFAAQPRTVPIGADLSRLAPVKAVLRGHRGTLRLPESGDLAAFSPVSGTSWGVVVNSAASEALVGPFANNLPGFGAGLGLTALAAVGFAYWLSERISRPLQQLSERMQGLALGNSLDPPPTLLAPATALEVQVLIDSFRTMRQRIGSEAAANRRLVANLSAEKGKLELIIESITEGVLVYEESGQVITANSALWTQLDSAPATLTDWRALPLRDALGETLPSERSVLARAVRLGSPESALYRLARPGSPLRILQIAAAPLRIPEGSIIGGVAIVRDVTAQKESERLREDFVATLTHDLRTPLLAAVQTLGFTLEGQYGPLSDGQQQILLAVIESHRELLGLVESLLTIYRYEAGRMRLRKEPTDLVALTASCLEEVGTLATARKLSLSLDAPNHLPPVPCDRQQLRRVIINLVDNALKFTPTGGRVEVRLLCQDAGVQLSVRDTGRGIAPEKQAALFVRFAQADSYSTGTGLGLYLCRQVIEAHGGRIWVESEPGLGSTFAFDLPLNSPSG
ncbi:ATP-binding protein [Gloeobacter kilaueensis]|uniref:histidine kinase n=1 Tax=Gloeobacter kilaueensis (strain ATCC BAA-2537 / CCAP 1431/1 / ULC 316 / JS1) TaxID=1183438 RepID=U5QK38_GLOK1|nr:ATP-binding protein [Gloeobacter kilaueensis]AGY59291.1 multi-sensor signal transduction histidine kinase [Gloeobacter kilaueensis JS1]